MAKNRIEALPEKKVRGPRGDPLGIRLLYGTWTATIGHHARPFSEFHDKKDGYIYGYQSKHGSRKYVSCVPAVSVLEK